MFPWRYTDAPCSIWLDASVRITSPHMAAGIIEHANPLAFFPHPGRDCIYREAIMSLGMDKYTDEPITEQVEHYREQGHPEHWGLFEINGFGRRHTLEVKDFCELWWGEIERWSFQDQLSLPYVLRASGLHWEPFPRDDFMEWAMSEKHMMANALNAAEVNMGAYLHG
jgi:hypothetical protein